MIGHGTLGLRDSIPTFRDITGRSNARGYPLIECGFGIIVETQWVQHNGNTWKTTANYVIGGILRDIIGVDASTPARWTSRKETLNLCINNSNSYFCDTEAARVPQEYWDQAEPPPGWDSWESFFDVYPPLDLYLNLGGIDPNSVEVVAELGFFYSPRAVRHPVMGENILLNGSFEGPGFGTDSAGSDIAEFRDDNVYRGAESQGLSATGAKAGNFKRYFQQVDVQHAEPGGRFRFSGAYWTGEHPDSTPGATDQDDFRAWVGFRMSDGTFAAGTLEMAADGRGTHAVGATRHLLAPTDRRWRRFLFEFVWPSGSGMLLGYPFVAGYAAIGGTNGHIYFDDISFARVFRYHDYEDRLTEASVPELEMASADIFLGRRTTGLGGMSLVNSIGERSLSRQIGGLLLARRPVKILAGGMIDGIDLVREDCRAQFYGRINTVEASDNQVGFGLEDPISDLLDTKLPFSRATINTFARAGQSAVGKLRPVIFGGFSAVPQRSNIISTDQTTGYGTYEAADTDRAPNGISALAVIAYRAAENYNADPLNGGRVLDASEYTTNLLAATLSIVKDVRDLWRDGEGKDFGAGVLDFDIGGANIAAPVFGTEGTQPWKLAADLTTQWTALAGVTITWEHNETTHKMRVFRSSGTLNLRIKTGPNSEVAKKFWEALGFDGDVDLTGFLSYDSDHSVFRSAEQDHVIALQITGYKDDSLGTYTALANGPINYPSQMAHFILREFLGQSPARIDALSFGLGTITDRFGPYCMSLVMQRVLAAEAQETARIILQRIAQGAMAELYCDGDGVWHWAQMLDLPHVNTAILTHIDDDDILPGSWGVYQRRSDTYREAEVDYLRSAGGIHQTFGIETVRTVWDPNVPMKYGREEVLTVKTYHGDTGGAEYEGGPQVHGAVRLSRIFAKWSAKPPLAVTLAVRHSLSGHKINDRFLLSRDEAFTEGGKIVGVVMRIIRVTQNFFTGISNVVAIKDIAMGIAGGQPGGDAEIELGGIGEGE